LPAQPEANPKQCGAVTTSNAVMTRLGKIVGTHVAKPEKYIAPARRSVKELVKEFSPSPTQPVDFPTRANLPEQTRHCPVNVEDKTADTE